MPTVLGCFYCTCGTSASKFNRINIFTVIYPEINLNMQTQDFRVMSEETNKTDNKTEH